VRLEELTDEELRTLTGDFENLRTRMAATGQGPNSNCSIPDRTASKLKPEAEGAE
jgi:hypothetical protein